MGTGPLPSAISLTIIPPLHNNSLRSSLIGDFVPRGPAGTVQDIAGSLGTAALKWLSVSAHSIFIGANGTIEIIEDANNDMVIKIGGAEKARISAISGLIPSGVIWELAHDNIPDGWALCDGSEQLRVGSFANLFAALGTTWGQGDNSTTFNLPSSQGIFFRGRDNGTGNDPDAGSRTAIKPGGATGDAVGSFQDSEVIEHGHPLRGSNEIGGNTDAWPPQADDLRGVRGDGNALIDIPAKPSVYTTQKSLSTDTVNPIKLIGGAETRPKNAYVNFIIKL